MYDQHPSERKNFLQSQISYDLCPFTGLTPTYRPVDICIFRNEGGDSLVAAVLSVRRTKQVVYCDFLRTSQEATYMPGKML